jgi:hypothetical protein
LTENDLAACSSDGNPYETRTLKYGESTLTSPYALGIVGSMIGDRVFRTIQRAELEVRSLLAEAATLGDYEMVSRLSAIARQLSDLAEVAADKPLPVVDGHVPPTRIGGPSTAAMWESPAPRRNSRKEGYPRFLRSRDTLVKVGWSKKEQSEYVHKAPKAGVDAVARRVMDLGQGGRMFTTDELLPVKLSAGGDELPSYQAYICLAWLRDIGVVEQHGREGYSAPRDDLIGTVSRYWDSLSASRR